MSLLIDDDGTISLYQGDSGEIVISGFDDKKNYTVCLAIQNSDRKIIGEELKVAVNALGLATFILTPNYTDMLKVPNNKPFEIYYYGIKVCDLDNTTEDTLFIGDSTYGDINRMIVYPRKVVGV